MPSKSGKNNTLFLKNIQFSFIKNSLVRLCNANLISPKITDQIGQPFPCLQDSNHFQINYLECRGQEKNVFFLKPFFSFIRKENVVSALKSSCIIFSFSRPPQQEPLSPRDREIFPCERQSSREFFSKQTKK